VRILAEGSFCNGSLSSHHGNYIKIPSGGFFSFIKTDIVEDKYYEKRANFGLESDNMSLGANR
jgi:hypothetical protein